MQSRQEALIHLSQWLRSPLLCRKPPQHPPPFLALPTSLGWNKSILILTSEFAEPKAGRSQIRYLWSAEVGWDPKLITVPATLRASGSYGCSWASDSQFIGFPLQQGVGKNSLLETRFYWDVATPLCVYAMLGFFPASSCNRHHMVPDGNIYYLSLPEVCGPCVLGITKGALLAPALPSAPSGFLPKATQMPLLSGTLCCQGLGRNGAGGAGTIVWVAGATCCECRKHFYRAASWASGSPSCR